MEVLIEFFYTDGLCILALYFLSKISAMRGGNQKVQECEGPFRYALVPTNPSTPSSMSKSQKKRNYQSITNQATNPQHFAISSQNLISRKPFIQRKEINSPGPLVNFSIKTLFKTNQKKIEVLKEVESVSSLDTFQDSKTPDQKSKQSVDTKKQVLHESKEISKVLSQKKYNNYITSSYNINVRIEKNQQKNKKIDVKSQLVEANKVQMSLMEGISQTKQVIQPTSPKNDPNNLLEQKSKRMWSPTTRANVNSPKKLDKLPFQSPKLNLQTKKPKKVVSSAQISKTNTYALYSKNLVKKTKKIELCSNKQVQQTKDTVDSNKPAPRFLHKKTPKPIKKVLPINQIVKLNVLTNGPDQVIASLHILKQLAENETTTVYLVREINTNFLFCLKKCFIRNDPKQFQFLMREGKFGAQLNHPLVLKTYCTLYDKQNVYQLMEYMQGSTLFQKTHEQRCSIVKRKSSKSTSSTSDIKIRSIKLIMATLLEAIVYMHSQGIIHRDIKPSNIFIAYDNALKIGDFGSCGYQGSRDYVGTLDYVTPEVMLRKKYDSKVDVWSVGCIGYELWTGSPPFYHTKRETTINNIIEKDFDRTKIQNASFLNLLTYLLQKDSNNRITAAEALEHPFLKPAQPQSQ